MKKLIESKDEVFFTFEKRNKVKFLKQLKKYGCTWIDGRKIRPLLDNVRPPMSVKNNKLSVIPYFAAVPLSKRNNIKLIEFEDLGE